MPIKSYLVYARPGRRDELANHLRAIPDAEVLPAENKDLVVLVTETASETGENALETRIAHTPSLDSFHLVCAAQE